MFGKNWKGITGSLIVAIGGVVKILLPDSSDQIDQFVNGIIILGTALGLFGIRQAQGPQ